MPEVITNHLDLWTSALRTKSTTGRGSNGRQEAYGIKKLRELILELAVRGMLVPQDPNDKAASELLKRTITKKERLIKEGAIRKSKPPVFPVDSPDYELPASWAWTSLFEIGEISPRTEADDTVEASFVPMQAISEKYGVPVQHEVKPWGEIKSGFTHFREEDVVLAKITPCFQNGKSAVMRGLTNGFGAGTTELHVYRSINACTVPEYVLVYLKSPKFIGDGIPKMTGTAGQKRITRDYFAGNHFPLPPLAEQHRIVAKVDELMALCDQLEQQQNHSLEAHKTLVETLLGTLTSVGSPQELTEAWARIAGHFDTLFTTEHSIDQLKQAILQLAVMGKLVPQDPSDEPASVLLEKIAKGKARLVNDGEIKQEKSLPEIGEGEKSFRIPHGWGWVRLGHICAHITQGPNPKYDGIEEEEYRVVKTKDFYDDVIYYERADKISSRIYREHRKHKLITGDLIIGLVGRGSTGKCNVFVEQAEKKYIYTRATGLMRLVSVSLVLPDFLKTVFVSTLGKTISSDLEDGSTGQIVIKTSLLKLIPIALPPVLEQHRIVAKVNELMALCDALKACIKEAQTTNIYLADAIVEQAVA